MRGKRKDCPGKTSLTTPPPPPPLSVSGAEQEPSLKSQRAWSPNGWVTANSKHWFTTSFGGKCRKAMLGVKGDRYTLGFAAALRFVRGKFCADSTEVLPMRL